MSRQSFLNLLLFALYTCPRLLHYHRLSLFPTICPSFNHVILLGDFNLPNINWDTLTGISTDDDAFCDMCFQFNLLQLVNCPTRILGNTLDLMLTKNNDLLNKYFHSVFTQPSSFIDCINTNTLSSEIDTLIFSEEEVYSALIQLDPNKATNFPPMQCLKNFRVSCLQ